MVSYKDEILKVIFVIVFIFLGILFPFLFVFVCFIVYILFLTVLPVLLAIFAFVAVILDIYKYFTGVDYNEKIKKYLDDFTCIEPKSHY